ncbi:MAG: VOC family protein [Loigolactobacillus coryniformis]|jgi:glyoxylase I family protein|uniref:VOC family protein n=1 Tax=Loigolactobacillus coryniformis TaxID=1610 RepID=A0A5B8TDF6_9LACO|nr:VOC family protein [Loigolactobacillus coryniformis]MDT3392935.1 VOC family protein [Bacillota bacterium]RRG05353.1 MAG: VOC family protein [Lactobacillus sp.]MDN5951549.1 VOC family protein [Loigolactobacillus coryniformis]MDN5953315.1 VOC family protein [Loigolactobacillus coryniformis]QEA52467.1 VOC family protein [Loigolactobacillus coryniformis]
MQLNQLHHIAIICSDYTASKHFYCDLLGFTPLHEVKRADKGDVKLDVTNGDLQLELFIKAAAPQRISYPEAQGLRHIAFKVADVAATVAELNQRGIKTEPIRQDSETGAAMTFFFDPDGLPLELHE